MVAGACQGTCLRDAEDVGKVARSERIHRPPVSTNPLATCGSVGGKGEWIRGNNDPKSRLCGLAASVMEEVWWAWQGGGATNQSS
jgi:hypothetical protein